MQLGTDEAVGSPVQAGAEEGIISSIPQRTVMRTFDEVRPTELFCAPFQLLVGWGKGPRGVDFLGFLAVPSPDPLG